jgi:hypothetical protein
MCLIIHKPAGFVFHETWLRDFYTRNRDGYGFMYSEGGKLYIHKSLGDVERFVAAFKLRMDKELLVHLRMRTHGDIDLENCHPYETLTPVEGGPLGAVWMMHNGVLSHGNTADRTKSDTWHYIRNTMQPLLRRDPMLLLEPEFQRLVKADIGSGNKFTFMTSRGDVVIINREAGSMYEQAWMSNSYAWNAPGRTAYSGSYQGSYQGNYNGHAHKPTVKASIDAVGFFALLQEKKFQLAWRELQHADFRDAVDADVDGVEELIDHIKAGSFIPDTDDEFIITWLQNLAGGFLTEAKRAERKSKAEEAKRIAKARAEAKKQEAADAANAANTTTASTSTVPTGENGASSSVAPVAEVPTETGTTTTKDTPDEQTSPPVVVPAAGPAVSAETINT